jgi:indole-3-glycerol phosphate synthase
MTTASSSRPTCGLLAEIVAAKRGEVAERRARIPEERLIEQAGGRVARPFAGALAAEGRAIIAEMKRKSPSRGILRGDYRPAEIARCYEAAGARALSVLTDSSYFGGSHDHLREARQAVRLPVLMKDFIVEPYQVAEAAAAGADAILLIVAALDDAMLRALLERAAGFGLEALVEVHCEEELERAAALGTPLIGINNRDLVTLKVDVETSLRLAGRLPRKALAVSESGLRSAQDLARLEAAGYRAFLIGERFMSAADPGAALRELL